MFLRYVPSRSPASLPRAVSSDRARWRRLLVVAVAALLAMLAGLSMGGCSARPGLDLAAGWRATEGLTGPALTVGAGEWRAAEPFDGASFDATPGCSGAGCAAPAPAPELVGKLSELEAAAARSRTALEALEARVAAGALSPEQAAAIRAAAADAEKADARARAAVAEATAAAARADAAKRAAESPPPVPTDWTPAGLVGFAVALGGWLLRRNLAAKAREAADRARADAEARARQLADEAVARYDALPFDAADAAAMERARAALSAARGPAAPTT